MNAEPSIIAPATDTVPVEMIDTIKPQRIPASWAGAVLAYRDGFLSQWPEDQIRRFHKLIGITVTGAPAMARVAREVDVENFDATVQGVPPFLEAREDLGHYDGTVYCSRVTLPSLFRQLGPRRPRLHIATLDNQRWTPAELAADIQGNPDWRVPVITLELEAMIWAIQCYTADPGAGIYWDTSLVYGARDFWDPTRGEPLTAARLSQVAPLLGTDEG